MLLFTSWSNVASSEKGFGLVPLLMLIGPCECIPLKKTLN